MTERLTLRACGQRIDLRLFDGKYPEWRKLQFGILPAERVDAMTIASRMFQMVGKLKGVHAVDLDFHGREKYVEIKARGDTEVRGVLMPMSRPKERT